ncbi:hypothetical protein GCM10022227_13760 [Streptomyces sedi]
MQVDKGCVLPGRGSHHGCVLGEREAFGRRQTPVPGHAIAVTPERVDGEYDFIAVFGVHSAPRHPLFHPLAANLSLPVILGASRS